MIMMTVVIIIMIVVIQRRYGDKRTNAWDTSRASGNEQKKKYPTYYAATMSMFIANAERTHKNTLHSLQMLMQEQRWGLNEKKKTESMKMKNVHVECIPPNVLSRKSLNVRLWVCSECICVCGWLVLLFFFLFLFCLSFVVAGRRHFVVVVHLLLIPVWAPSFRHYLLHFYARNKLSVSCFVVHRVVYFIDIFFNRHSHMSLNLCALFFLNFSSASCCGSVSIVLCFHLMLQLNVRCSKLFVPAFYLPRPRPPPSVLFLSAYFLFLFYSAVCCASLALVELSAPLPRDVSKYGIFTVSLACTAHNSACASSTIIQLYILWRELYSSTAIVNI